MILANDCDGAGPHRGSEIRVYPLGAGGNLLLCEACWQRENQYRRERGQDTGAPENWPLEVWNTAEVYPP